MLHLMAVHGAKVGEVSYETDRMQFIGRGNTVADPQAMSGPAPLSGTVNLGPGAQYCLTVTVHLPINCTQGEINAMCWTVTPQSAPSLEASRASRAARNL